MMRALVLALSFVFATTAFAQQDRFSRGLAAYQHGDYQTAAMEWNAAYAANPEPRLLFNIARAYMRLGRLSDARGQFEQYLASSPDDAESLAETRANLAAIRERLAHTGIRIRCATEGATIWIDGVEWGRTPRPDAISVDPGVRRVVVRAPDGREFAASIGVREGAVEQVDAELTVQPQSTAAPQADQPQQAPVAALAADAPAAQSSSGIVVQAPSIALLSIGGASIVTGVVLGVLANSAANDAAASDDDKASQARSLALGADITLFGGLAIAATGAILIFVLPHDQHDVAVAPVVAPGFAGAAASIQF